MIEGQSVVMKGLGNQISELSEFKCDLISLLTFGIEPCVENNKEFWNRLICEYCGLAKFVIALNDAAGIILIATVVM